MRDQGLAGGIENDPAPPGVFQANVRRPLALQELARRMGMSESTLSHKCSRLLGVTPARAFLRCRLGRVAVLLSGTSLSVN